MHWIRALKTDGWVPDMSEKLLEIKDLHVVYNTDEGTVYAINGMDLSVEKGQVLGLVGETGAGKTTMALTVLRLLPDRIGEIKGGSIRLEDTDIIRAPEAEMKKIRGNKLSMIFQDPMTSLNPIMTVGEQIAEVLEIHNKDMSKQQIETRVDEMLTLVGISPERKTDYPHQFSGGMKQRVVIAIALACTPDLLIADEPTTALDVTIQDQVLQMMRGLKEKFNTAMILITHDLGVVANNCDSVAIMYAGEVIEYGKVEDIFEGADRHPYTIGLFGSIPDLTKKERRLHPIEGLMPDPSHLPQGCSFHERCPGCTEKCRTQKPEAVTRGTHMIRCHYGWKEDAKVPGAI